jgi:nitrate/TMAO reductase-like tetraheme cytochrome c subunit
VYVGSERCIECHEEAYAFWKKTKHARAWATLEEQGKHFDLTCIGCHTVGYEQAGGFCRLKDVGALKDVGCEMCHGAGSVHVEDQDSSSIKLTAPVETCTALCHVPDHSDSFVYEKYLREITGKGHELSSGG